MPTRRPSELNWFERKLSAWLARNLELYGDSVSVAAPAVQKSDTTPETRAGRRRTGRP